MTVIDLGPEVPTPRGDSRNRESMIRDTLAKTVRQVRDVNKDGLVNCIDYAVVFWELFPDKHAITISYNENVGGVAHLFNVVYTSGRWRAVEPQAGRHKDRGFWMRDYWGSRYSPSENIDYTHHWKRYAN
jgi:hypothetical protein